MPFPRIGSVPFPVKPYLLGKPLPGRRQPVKAASREAVARSAPALMMWTAHLYGIKVPKRGAGAPQKGGRP
jgi:hypothetical protein